MAKALEYTIWKREGGAAKVAVKTITLSHESNFLKEVGLVACDILNKSKGVTEIMVFEKGQSGLTRWWGYKPNMRIRIGARHDDN